MQALPCKRRKVAIQLGKVSANFDRPLLPLSPEAGNLSSPELPASTAEEHEEMRLLRIACCRASGSAEHTAVAVPAPIQQTAAVIVLARNGVGEV